MGLRFRSSEELLKFFGERFDLVMASSEKARAECRTEPVAVKKKSRLKERSST